MAARQIAIPWFFIDVCPVRQEDGIFASMPGLVLCENPGWNGMKWNEASARDSFCRSLFFYCVCCSLLFSAACASTSYSRTQTLPCWRMFAFALRTPSSYSDTFGRQGGFASLVQMPNVACLVSIKSHRPRTNGPEHGVIRYGVRSKEVPVSTAMRKQSFLVDENGHFKDTNRRERELCWVQCNIAMRALPPRTPPVLRCRL